MYEDNGGEESEVEEVPAPVPASDLAAARPAAAVVVASSLPPPSPSPVKAPLSPRSSLWSRYKKSWGPKFDPKNVLKTGLKGATTEEREDFQTVLKGIAKKHLDRNEVVVQGYNEQLTIDRSLSFYLSVPFPLSLSLSLTPSRLFSCIILCWTLGCLTIRWGKVSFVRLHPCFN
jgi:hypothetical protein